MQIKLLEEGGNMKPGPALSQKLGPTGIKISDVISKVNGATQNFKGMKVPLELNIDLKTKEIDVKVFSPPVSELIKKELGIPKGSGMQKKMYAANASIEQMISVAKTKFQNLLCNDLKSAVKTVVGSCVSLGILVENKPASEIEADIDAGKYDKEIKAEKIVTPPEKKAELKAYFENLKAQQEKKIKQEEAAKAAADEEKKAATPAAVAATPVTAAKKDEKPKAEKAKTEKK